MNKTQKAKLVKLVGSGLTAGEIAEKLKLDTVAVEAALNKLKDEELTLTKAKTPRLQEPTFRGGDKTGEASAVTENITSLNGLLDACEVDRNHWKVQNFTVDKFDKAYNNGSDELVIRPVFQIKASLVKQPNLPNLQLIGAGFQKKASAYRPMTARLPRRRSDEGLLYEINIADMHIGKLAWSMETGDADYDTATATELCGEAFQELARKAPKGIDKILLPIGNDFLNVDSMSRETTGGTPQDEDGRWQKTFVAASDILTKSITKYLVPLANVEILIVPGNHDTQRSFYLGECLRHHYLSHSRVTVDNSPCLRKYFVFGQNLLGFTHGDKEKVSVLHNIMAQEQPQAWARTSHWEWQLGHLHTEILRISNGVIVRNLSSLSPADAWHASNGYKGNVRKAEGFVYKPEGGLVSKTSFIAQQGEKQKS